jgi:large subunit ribosomal protein L17
MFRNMVTSLFKYDRIRTTDIKAKELRSWADHLVTLAKRGDLHARRQALSIVREKDVVHKLFEEAPKRFGSIAGGYTRMVRIARRAGDSAPMCIIELVSSEKALPKKSKKKETAPKSMETTEPVKQEKVPAVQAEVAEARISGVSEPETPVSVESAMPQQPETGETAGEPSEKTEAGSQADESKQ